VRAERYSVVEGKTPEIQRKQAEVLIKSIETIYVKDHPLADFLTPSGIC
jgi:hypothetical protein